MDYTFASRVDSVLDGRLPAQAGGEGLLDLSTGAPPASFFPVEQILPISARILADEPVTALQYGVTEGYAPLQNSVRTLLNERWPLCRLEDQVLILSGSTQAIDLTVKCFCNEGDGILCAANTPQNRLGLFHAYGGHPVFVKTGPEGLDLADLEAQAAASGARLLYVMPDFADPDGATMPARSREQLYRLACSRNLILLEDGSMRPLRAVGEDLPPIKALDEDGRVVYCGSFSNLLTPALRLGYLSANGQVTAKLTVAKQCSDVHTTVWSQLVVHQLLESGQLPAHLEKVRTACADQWEAVAPQASRLFAGKASFHIPEGGLFLALELPHGQDALEVAGKAAQQGLFVAVAGPRTLRINLLALPADQVVKGLTMLAGLL